MKCPACHSDFERGYLGQVYCGRGCAKRAMDRRRRHRNVRYVWEDKSTRGCNRCDESRVPCLDYHHLDPNMKIDGVNALMDGSLSKLKAEILKCEILCANCHRIEEAQRRAQKSVVAVRKPSRSHRTLPLFAARSVEGL